MLVFLVGQMAKGSGAFEHFCINHPRFEAQFEYKSNGKSNGFGKFYRNSDNGLKIFYVLQQKDERYSYVYNQGTALESWFPDRVWDRLKTLNEPVPRDRYSSDVPYPLPLALSKVVESDNGIAKQSVQKQKDGTEYFGTITTRSGPQILYFKLANDGRLLIYGRKKPTGEILFEFDFIRYTFQPQASSLFSLKPPIGYDPYAFPIPPDPLVSGQKLPSSFASGHPEIAKKISSGKWMLVMTDQFLPAGFKAGLQKLPVELRIIGLATKGHEALLKNALPKSASIYSLSESDFDLLGVAATPQFYLMRNGKLVQAWLGFDSKEVKKWVQEVHNSLQGS